MKEKIEELARKLNGKIINVGKIVKTVEQAAKETNTDPEHIIKSLLFITSRGPVLVVVDGKSKVDSSKLERYFGSSRLATPEEVKKITGYEIGEIPPVGISVETVVDPKVLENDFVLGGGGSIDKLLKLNPKQIVKFQKARIIHVKS